MAKVVTTRTQLGAQLTSVVNSEQTLSADLDLRTRYGAEVEILVNSDQATPVDALICRVYLSMDDTNYSSTPWQAFTVGPPPDTNDFRKLYNFGQSFWYVRFGFLSEGSTDTYTVDVYEGQISGL